MQRIAFEIGPFWGGRSFAIYWYAVMVATGFLVGLWTASRRAERAGIPREKILDLGPLLLGGAIVGSRALFVVSYWKEYFASEPWWEVFMIRHGGLVYFGGLVGASVSFILYARWRKLPLWKMADVFAPSLALGQAIGRVGCFLNGCCYGKPTALPWGVHFPTGHETGGVAVHPTQLYASLVDLGLCAALAWLHRRKKFDGQVFAAYLVGYSILRSLVEVFRGDYAVYYLGFATPAQLASVGVLAVGGWLYWKLARANGQTVGPGRA